MKIAILISFVCHALLIAAVYYPLVKSTKADRLPYARNIADIINSYDPYSALPMSKNIEDRRDERH